MKLSELKSHYKDTSSKVWSLVDREYFGLSPEIDDARVIFVVDPIFTTDGKGFEFKDVSAQQAYENLLVALIDQNPDIWNEIRGVLNLSDDYSGKLKAAQECPNFGYDLFGISNLNIEETHKLSSLADAFCRCYADGRGY